ncbi:glycosyltransferase [Candidatus Saccharibacteria bacterium]|nr:glycosyltransferase [Candidatus Saccharibacteria bacterium]
MNKEGIEKVRKPSVSVICPVFNAQNEILDFDRSLKKQKGVRLTDVIYVLTESSDHTEDVMKAAGIPYKKIKRYAFSHSLVREKAGMSARGRILVFLTQDVEIRDENFLAKLVAPIVNGEVQAAYAKQETKYNNIEKYTRAHNYPNKSFIVSKADIERRGLKTFFFSDAAGAIDASVFRRLKGYDGKELPISEDMYFAYKLIMHGGKIKYVADAVVYHSHDFKLSELYDRYKLTGKFMKQNPEIAEHGVNSAGGGMAKSVLVGAIKDKNLRVLGGYVPNMAVRYAGMTRGKGLGKRGIKNKTSSDKEVERQRGRAHVFMRRGVR